MEHSCAKQIVVLEKDGHTIEVLRRILKSCKKENYEAVSVSEPLPEGTPCSVLLLCCGRLSEAASGYGVCVSDLESVPQSGLSGPGHLVTYSVDRNDADYTAKNIRTLRDGFTAFEIVGSGIIGRVRLGEKIPGVRCALAAASAAVAAGIPFADVLRALNDISAADPPGSVP